MNKQKEIIGNYEKTETFYGIIGSVFFYALSFYLIKLSIQDIYIQIIPFLLGCLTSLIAIFLTLNLIYPTRIKISENKLIIEGNPLVHRVKVSIEEIESFYESEKENKYFNWKELNLITSKSRVKVSSFNLSNYDEIKRRLIKGKIEDINKKQQILAKNNIIYGYIILIICVLITLLSFYSSTKISTTPSLTKVNGFLSEDIKLKISENRKNRRKYRSIKISLKEYPKSIFKLGEQELMITNITGLKRLKEGENIQLIIEEMVFKKKLSRELPLNFWDKTIGYRNIQVYGVKQDSVDFLNPEKYFHYNKNKKKGFGSILWKIILILFFLLGIYLIIKGEWRQPT